MSTNTEFIEYSNAAPMLSQNALTKSILLNAVDLPYIENFFTINVFSGGIFEDTSRFVQSMTVYPIDLSKFTENYSQGQLYIGGTDKAVKGVGLARELTLSPSLLDLGSYYFEPYFNNYADYSGYTRIKMWLPFYGFIDIEPNDVIGKRVNFKLRIDLSTNLSTYIIGVAPNKNSKLIERVISIHNFDFGIPLPLTATTRTELIRNVVMGGLKLVLSSALNMAGAGAHLSGYSITNESTINQKVSPKTGRLRKTSTSETTSSVEKYTINKGSEEQLFSDAIDVLNSLGAHTSSSIVPSTTCLSDMSRSIQIMIYRPKFIPTKSTFNFLYGKPLGETHQLKNLKGYTEISSIHLEGVGFGQATSREISEIEQELSNGVIL